VLAITITACSEPDPSLGVSAALGAQAVKDRGCPACHQSSRDSDGILSGQSTPVPGTSAYGTNLTPDRPTGLGTWADIQIVRAIRFGVDNGLAPLCDAMPKAPDMSDLEAYSITAYLRQLPAVPRHDIPQSTCPPVKPMPPLDLSVSMPVPGMDGSASD
jgi:hypothetical protein